jgi:hypothetical protein
MPNRKTKNQKAKRLIQSLLLDKRAISVALSTMIITAGVIAAGIAVLYWATSWGNVANQQYSATVANSQNAIGERLAFEYTTYNTKQLTVYLINCGKSNNVTIVAWYIYNASSRLVGSYHSPTGQRIQLTFFDLTKTSLDVGVEAYFSLNSSLNSGYYTLRLVTERGRNFDGTFSAP